MTEPLSKVSSVAANSQMTALAAVQSQLASEGNRAPVSAGSAAVRSAAASSAESTSVSSAAKADGGTSAKAESKPSADELHAAAKQITNYFQPDQKVTLQVDHDSGESYVKIIDAKSKQLILQIPSKEVLAMARKLREAASPQSASGVLVDQEG